MPTLEVLAQRHDVYAPDLPGCGRSSRPDRPLHISELADAVIAGMDAAGIDRPVLVGHSVGCQVLAHLAERHPERVHSLVMASPTGDPAMRRWHQALSLLGDAAREPPRLLPIVISDYLRAGPVRVWHTFRMSRRDDDIERLKRLRHRSLVVRGGNDPVVSADWVQTVADALRAELVTIPAAPHGLPFSAAPQLARTINDHVTS